MIKFPHWTIICIAIGAFLLPVSGGHFSIEAGQIDATDNVLRAALDGESAPFLAHFFISLFFFVPLTATLFLKKISHVVNMRITMCLAVFAACIGVSIVVSSFPAVTILTILDWAMMSLAFFSVTLCCGRKQSIVPVSAFIGGSTLAAILGILEYGQQRAGDPGWRIYALQLGPNQAGALFAAGTILCLTLSLRFDRIAKLALILSAILQSFALVLTQSKGAILCLPIGIAIVIVGLLSLKSAKPGSVIAGILLPLLVTGALSTAAQHSAASQAGRSGISRITNSGSESAQSLGFRKLLWASAIDLAKDRPYGWGLGTYWYESSRPGRVTQTALAHQTFLQLACEASPIAPISLAAFLLAVTVWGLRGIRNLEPDTQIFLVAVLGTLATAVAHNFIDSDMYVFGLGGLVFLLCGTFTASSTDSQAPEFIFALPKIAFAATAAILIPLCFSVGLAELYRSEARGAFHSNDVQGLIANANAAISVSFADGQAFALKSLAEPTEENLVATTRLHPSPKAYRALADYYFRKGQTQESYRALNRALERDPNNAPALKRYIEVAEKAGDMDLARSKAQQLVATEKTTYFTVRSEPELIPTQTYAARMFLAKTAKTDQEKVQYLADAIKGFMLYRDTTGPVVKRVLASDPKANYAGEDKDKLRENFAIARDACNELIPLQRRLGLTLGFDPAAEAAKFDAALDELNK